MNSDKIADLYSSGDISGYAYLACVEREIYTVGDAVTKGVLDDPSLPWAKEIESFVDQPGSDNSEVKTPQDEASRKKVWEVVKNVHDDLKKDIDVRTRSALSILQGEYSTFEDYLEAFLNSDDEFWAKFRSLRSIGRKSILRANAFAETISKVLESGGVSIQALFDSGSGNLDVDQIQATDKDRIIEDAVKREMEKLSARSSNALQLLLGSCDNSYTTFYNTIISKDFDVWQLRNVGQKSAPEITSFVIRVQTRVIDRINLWRAEGRRVIENQTLLNNIVEEGNAVPKEEKAGYDAFRPFFESKMHDLSTRSYHAISDLFLKCGNSVSKFLEVVSNPDFKVSSLPAVGRKSSDEISLWISYIRGLLLSGSKHVEEFEKKTRACRYERVGIKGDAARIENISSTIGHFALFTAIEQYIESLSERERAITKGQLKIYANQSLSNRKESAKALGITPERMRQIRIAQFKKLSEYVRWLSRFRNDYSEHIYKRDEITSINNTEHTSFSENFILWAISVVWQDDYVLFGDVDIAFTNPYGYDLNLALVPSNLADIYDFNGLIRYFEGLNESRRTDKTTLPIRDFVLQFFRNRIYYESLEEIEKECRLIASRVFGFEVLSDSIVIEKNAFRKNTEWVEIIIREVGHPLTIDEIYDELEKRHPGKSKSALALSGAVRNNPNLVPIGRSSTFGLKEWTNGQHRGGTIREFATEYLLSLPMPIAPLEEIGKYVRQFRPSSSDKSIHANLLLEQSGAFSMFYDRNDNRYIGLANYDYGDEYRIFDPIRDAKRDFKTSCTLIEQFVAEKGRLPFHNEEDEEELRLCRFWHVQQSKLQKGQLQDGEAEIITSMIERLSKYRVNKGDYQWRKKYDQVKEVLAKGQGLAAIPGELRQWLINQRRAYDYGRMPEDRVPMFKELLEFAQRYAKRL